MLRIPQLIGHRGASAALPENTLASFEAAARAGAWAIESDAHLSADGEVILLHDPTLERTTNGRGLVSALPYHGPTGMSALRTLKSPHQPIPLIQDMFKLMLRPEFTNLIFNIGKEDIKLKSPPLPLFQRIHETLATFPDYHTTLVPRIILGVWHTATLDAVHRATPYLLHSRVAHIGRSTAIARQYFWDACSIFSMNFDTLNCEDGTRFIQDCHAAQKSVWVWTVNEEQKWATIAKWNCEAVICDTTDAYRAWAQTNTDNAQSQESFTTVPLASDTLLGKLRGSFTDTWCALKLRRAAGPLVKWKRPLTVQD